MRVREMFERVQRLRQRDDAEVRAFAEQSFLDAIERLQVPTSSAADHSMTLAMHTMLADSMNK